MKFAKSKSRTKETTKDDETPTPAPDSTDVPEAEGSTPADDNPPAAAPTEEPKPKHKSTHPVASHPDYHRLYAKLQEMRDRFAQHNQPLWDELTATMDSVATPEH